MTSRGWFVRSEAQSQKLDRKPCGMAAMPCSLTSFESVMSESAFPRRLGNTSPTPSLSPPRAGSRPPRGTGISLSLPGMRTASDLVVQSLAVLVVGKRKLTSTD